MHGKGKHRERYRSNTESSKSDPMLACTVIQTHWVKSRQHVLLPQLHSTHWCYDPQEWQAPEKQHCTNSFLSSSKTVGGWTNPGPFLAFQENHPHSLHWLCKAAGQLLREQEKSGCWGSWLLPQSLPSGQCLVTAVWEQHGKLRLSGRSWGSTRKFLCARSLDQKCELFIAPGLHCFPKANYNCNI